MSHFRGVMQLTFRTDVLPPKDHAHSSSERLTQKKGVRGGDRFLSQFNNLYCNYRFISCSNPFCYY